MDQDRLWFLLARQLSEEASASEAEELQHLLKQYPDKQYLADIISTYFKATSSETGAGNPIIDFNQRFNRIISADFKDADEPAVSEVYPSPEHNPGNKKHIFRLNRLIPYAAAVFGIGFTLWMVYHSSKPVVPANNLPPQTSEVIARPGARSKLVLPDGTQVWLNSGSKLHYKNDFNNSLREVELEGEAFFDVVSDAEHPFIVHTSAIDVKVLGTAFNIKSYPRDEVIETTLLRGLVEVTRKDDPSAPKVILRPNEKLIFNKNPNPIHLPVPADPHAIRAPERISNISITPISKNIPDSDKVETSWMYNKLVFDGDSFEELAAKMERWYNIKIIFNNPRLLKYRFKGVFYNETVQEALDALRLTARFSYTLKGNEIELNKE